MITVLHLFETPDADARDARRRARKERAEHQGRCLSCGRFATEFAYGSMICRRCPEDPRPAIQVKVEQAQRWWAALHTS